MERQRKQLESSLERKVFVLVRGNNSINRGILLLLFANGVGQSFAFRAAHRYLWALPRTKGGC
ncbi:hypothetical protein EMPG_12119, partial [Blastomyces silverae]